MNSVKSVSELCRDQNFDAAQLARLSGLDVRRVRAILEGRWTPSPAERERVAAVFGLTPEQVAWGHTTPVEHLYGHGPQFGRTP
jgi:transcriptional regulator with XRE-family HTH domain